MGEAKRRRALAQGRIVDREIVDKVILPRSREITPEQFAKMIASGEGGLVHAITVHDDDCPRVTTGGDCTCTPELKLRVDVGDEH